MDEANRKPRRGRRAHLADFRLGENGGYEYTGQTYSLQGGTPASGSWSGGSAP